MTSTTAPIDGALRRALQVNAAFSLASGLALLLAAGQLSGFIGIEPIVLRAVGIGLLPWAAMVFQTAQRAAVRRREVCVVIAGDLAWVAGTIILALAASSAFTVAGLITFLVLGAIVADFAAAQIIGLRRMGAAGS